MALSPEIGVELAQSTIDAIFEVEMSLLRRIVNIGQAASGIDERRFLESQIGGIQFLRDDLIEQVRAQSPKIANQITKAIKNGYKEGGQSFLFDMAARGFAVRQNQLDSPAAVATLQAIQASALERVESATQSILRTVPDQYAEAVRRAVVETNLGSRTYREAFDRNLKSFFKNGVSVAPANSRGARMSLTDYLGMATRTASARAAIEGHTAAMRANGLDFVMIQLGPRNCERCDVWANKVLTTSGGPLGDVESIDYNSGGRTVVKVEGTLEEARTGGWGHPNCRCGVQAYIPGITKVDPNRPEWDREGYEAQQQQRANENAIRKAKMEEVLANTPEEQAAARAKIQALQEKQRDLMEQHPYLKRQPGREGNSRLYSDRVRSDARQAARNANPTGADFRNMNDAQKLEATRRMYGDNSPEYAAAKQRWGEGASSNWGKSKSERELFERLDSDFAAFERNGYKTLADPLPDSDFGKKIKQYTTNQGYAINDEIRIAKGITERKLSIFGPEYDPKPAQITRSLNAGKALEEGIKAQPPTTVDMRVERYASSKPSTLKKAFPGFPDDVYEDPAKLASALVGKRFEEPAFLSTSFITDAQDAARKAAYNPGAVSPGTLDNVYIEFLVPKGSKMVKIDTLSRFPDENEILFPPGVRFTVIDAAKREQGSGIRLIALIDSESTL